MVNSTNVGGRVVAWVANRILGCLPPRTGGGVAATTSSSQALSRPVGIRVSHDSSAVRSAGASFGDGPPGQRGDVDPLRPLHADQVAFDLALERQPPVLVDEVPLVERQHQRPPGLDRPW